MSPGAGKAAPRAEPPPEPGAKAAEAAPDQPGTLRLRIRDLTLVLSNGRRLLNRISFTVHSGEVVVILGRSGAGKSTLGDVLFDLLPDRDPGARIEATALEARTAGMALILQRGSLFDHLSVADNIRFAARRRRGVAMSSDAVTALLDEVGLPAHDGPVADLSGGEERRVNVARGLATDPELIFFDEPCAGLDLSNVYRVGGLIRKVCTAHKAGAVVVTHNPLLAALVADQLLYLDRQTGSLTPLIEEWQGPPDASDEVALTERREAVEGALLARDDALPDPPMSSRPLGAALFSALSRVRSALLAPGRIAADLAAILVKLPASVRHARDFLQLWWTALRLTGYSGLLFFVLVGAIFSATFLSIAFAAAALVSPQTVVDNLRGDFILAMTPPLLGFLFAARSGSALTAWLGGLSLRRQTDALASLGVSVDEYLRVPAFVGTFCGFVLATIAFGAAMYGAAAVTATGFGVAEAAATLQQTSPPFRRQLIEKTLLYGLLIGLVATHMGLLVKRTSQDVARGITRAIIFSTLAVVVSELFFAFDLHAL